MSYTIEYLKDKDVIYVKMAGDIDTVLARKIGCETAEFASGTSCKNFLCDFTQTSLRESTINLFDLASRLEEIGMKPYHRVAVVYVTEEKDHRFFETVARNRGWYNLRYFVDINEAFAWLGKESSKKEND